MYLWESIDSWRSPLQGSSGTSLRAFRNLDTREVVYASLEQVQGRDQWVVYNIPAEHRVIDPPVIKDSEPEKAKRNFLRPSAIILYGIATTLVLQQCAGNAATPFDCGGLFASLGSNGSSVAPDRGDCFNDGSQDFLAAAGSIHKDFPQVWCGAAAEGYADGTKTLVALAQQMSDLDQQMAATADRHALAVEDAQAAIAFQQDFLGGMFLVVLGLELKYPAMCVPGSPLWWFALVITVAAVLACVGCLIACHVKSTQHAAQARTLAYDEVAAAAREVAARYGFASAGSVLVASPTRFTYFEDMPETHAVVSAGRLRGFDQARTAVRVSTGQGQHSGATPAGSALLLPPAKPAVKSAACSASLGGAFRAGSGREANPTLS